MRLTNFRAGLVAFLGLSLSALAAIPAHPGTINFVEGSVSVDGKPVNSASIGSADLQPGSVLRTTDTGRAEVLLTPGVFLRVGKNSEIRLVSNGLTDTRVAVNRGDAMLEATEVHKENNIQIADDSLTTTVEKKGLYRFDADQSSVQVFDGQANVRREDTKVELKKGKEVVDKENAPLKVEKFDRDEAKSSDDLYQWSNLRSKYLSEASLATAQRIVVEPGGWYGAGWYWNPWMSTYSWLPGVGGLYSPFGYGFYSPRYLYAPTYVVPYRGYRGVRPAYGYNRVRPGFVGGGMRGMGMRGMGMHGRR